jgi:hypothetical protein
MRPTRRLALFLILLGTPALAHHGWRWTDGGDFELTGTITAVSLGLPHGILTVEANGEAWTVEVGQPNRNANAGLTDDLMAEGVEITVQGERSADPADLRVKAERLVIGGVTYDLYPERT